jgi:hypothetical protein
MFVFAVIHCVWGIGTGLILPLLLGRRRTSSAFA